VPGASVADAKTGEETLRPAGDAAPEPEPGAGVATPIAAGGFGYASTPAGAVTLSPPGIWVSLLLVRPVPQPLQYDADSGFSARQ